jgi:hypothetical protein
MWLVCEKNSQIRPVENGLWDVILVIVILFPVKYLLKLSGSRNFYRLRMTSTNVFTISCFSIKPSPRSGKFSSTALVHSLANSLLHYSSTIRGLFVLLVDNIRGLFVDYSHYSLHYSSFINYPFYCALWRHVLLVIYLMYKRPEFYWLFVNIWGRLYEGRLALSTG